MRLHFAAWEQAHKLMKRFCPAPRNADLFLTFYYENTCSFALRELKPQGHTGRLIIDSGAHSFFGYADMSAVTVYWKDKAKMPDPHAYFRRYLAWLKEYEPLYDFAVELDLQEIVGRDTVRQWRQAYKDAGVLHKIIQVYHTGDTAEDWDSMLSSPSRYCGIEGIRIGYERLPYVALLKEAYERNVRVHGFAFTRFQMLHDYPFYSVDSSSWKAIARFGAIQVWDEDQKAIKVVRTGRERFIDNNLPIWAHTSCRGNAATCLKMRHQMDQYERMRQHMTRYWEGRGVKWEP